VKKTTWIVPLVEAVSSEGIQSGPADTERLIRFLAHRAGCPGVEAIEVPRARETVKLLRVQDAGKFIMLLNKMNDDTDEMETVCEAVAEALPEVDPNDLSDAIESMTMQAQGQDDGEYPSWDQLHSSVGDDMYMVLLWSRSGNQPALGALFKN